jgi:hypothetical protein
MNAKETTNQSPDRIDGGIRRLAAELNREDSRLRSRLLDAALAGLRLVRNPESRELRHDAAQVWAAIEPILAHHLEAEDTELLPWLAEHGRLSPELARKVRECHERLRKLIGVMANASADTLSQAQARDVGQALSGLAVNLDDAIDDEERKLFPTIQKALFAIGRRG